ncbi:uncharacterized protein [Zea mays]|uniref:uncharacterized protein n=1 Tax=Zea mays TaxID=4577 RepID=UPI0004DE8F2E|nr:uncharacterized protein LOC100500963 [Zea mays]|eukprot:XP_023156461.1 uncharacterized protein LOC100500963 [Zea mays]
MAWPRCATTLLRRRYHDVKLPPDHPAKCPQIPDNPLRAPVSTPGPRLVLHRPVRAMRWRVLHPPMARHGCKKFQGEDGLTARGPRGSVQARAQTPAEAADLWATRHGEPPRGRKGDPATWARHPTSLRTSVSADIPQEHSANSNTSASSRLPKICKAAGWKEPSFDFEEQGPPHNRVFTCKVTVHLDELVNTIMECFSDPKPKKKAARENAAQGALWCLERSGYVKSSSDVPDLCGHQPFC